MTTSTDTTSPDTTSPDTTPHVDTPHVDTAPSGPSDPISVIQALYSAFGQGDVPAMLALIDPDVDWSVQVEAPGVERVPMFRNGHGHDAVLHYFSGVAQMDIEEFTPNRFHADGDVVLVELVLAFTHRETGKRVRADEIHRFTVRQGRIVRYRPFADTAAIIEAFQP